MRKQLLVLLLIASMTSVAQVPLDSCRNMALRNNKAILIANEKINAAGYQRSEAKAAYLPSLDFQASYLYNQKNI